jgi:tRNA (mo5U34)-methyltransferase
MPLPNTADSFLQSGIQFWRELQAVKEATAPPEPGWYPYETLATLPTITDLIAPAYSELREATAHAPVLDIGAGDGDFAMLMASFGIAVDAIDSCEKNFNRMRGIKTLRDSLRLDVRYHDLDLDRRFSLPTTGYGLTLLLGTRYHLKNPYFLLEELAFATSWCVLSTRIAQLTPREHLRVENEPVAYLADGREIANDATNYWIFSAAGLLRILQRTRWALIGSKRIGCLEGSTPTDPGADERMFLLLKSRVHAPELQVRPINGWHAAELGKWRWTEKSFSLQIILPLEQPVIGFEFSFHVPAAAKIECSIGGQPVPHIVVDEPGLAVIRAEVSSAAAHLPVLIAEFQVSSAFSPPAPDVRELGVCVPSSTGFPLRVF